MAEVQLIEYRVYCDVCKHYVTHSNPGIQPEGWVQIKSNQSTTPLLICCWREAESFCRERKETLMRWAEINEKN